MSLSDGEKLIVHLLLDVHRRLELNTVDHELIQNAVIYGDMWALKAKYPGIFGDSPERNPKDIQFVHDALSMWRIIEESYAHLSEDDQAKVRAAPGAHGDSPHFEGFDGHSDLVSIAHTMIEHLDYYEEFQGRALDAHMPINEVHERMVKAYLPLRERLHRGYFDADTLISIINERIHPENRG